MSKRKLSLWTNGLGEFLLNVLVIVLGALAATAIFLGGFLATAAFIVINTFVLPVLFWGVVAGVVAWFFPDLNDLWPGHPFFHVGAALGFGLAVLNVASTIFWGAAVRFRPKTQEQRIHDSMNRLLDAAKRGKR